MDLIVGISGPKSDSKTSGVNGHKTSFQPFDLPPPPPRAKHNSRQATTKPTAPRKTRRGFRPPAKSRDHGARTANRAKNRLPPLGRYGRLRSDRPRLEQWGSTCRRTTGEADGLSKVRGHIQAVTARQNFLSHNRPPDGRFAAGRAPARIRAEQRRQKRPDNHSESRLALAGRAMVAAEFTRHMQATRREILALVGDRASAAARESRDCQAKPTKRQTGQIQAALDQVWGGDVTAFTIPHLNGLDWQEQRDR